MATTANWAYLLGFMVRRDRVFLPVWVVSAVFFCVFLVPMMPGLAGTPDQLASLADMGRNPATVAMCGVIYGAAPSIGPLYSQMMMVWSGMLVATMSILVVARHTAAEEEAGRLEMTRALPTGRLATPVAVAVLVTAMNLAVALLTGLGMAAFGVASIGIGGSMVFGAVIGACGLLFGGLTLLVAQLVAGSRPVITVALSLMGAAYVWRAYGDLESETFSRLSPLGLMQRAYPFDADRWWPIAVLVAVAAVCFALAFALGAGRDVGLPRLAHWRRRHPGRASRWLAGELGLLWHVTRGGIIAWCVTAFVLSAGYGSVMAGMESFVTSNPVYQQFMGVGDGTADVMGPVVVTLMLLMGMMAVIPALTTAFRLNAEEQAGRLDLVLGRPVSRARLYYSLAGFGAVAGVAMMLVSALGFWGASAMVMAQPIGARVIFGAALNYLPAVLAFAGLGLLLAGAAKRLAWIAWAYLGASFLVVYLGDMANLPRWVTRLSPFGLAPRWPGEPFNWWVWALLLVVGAGLTVLGARGFGRRDVGVSA